MITLIAWSLVILFGQPENQHTMNLKIGYLSELYLQHSASTIRLPVKNVISVKPVLGSEDKIFTVTPLVKSQGQTNLRIYTEFQSYNILLNFNQPGSVTNSLDLRPPARNAATAAHARLLVKSEPQLTKQALKPAEIDLQQFALDSLLQVKPKLLENYKYGYAFRDHKAIFDIDFIFLYGGFLVFKITLNNYGSEPYHIHNLTIKRKRQYLAKIHASFKPRLVAPGQSSLIIYVTKIQGAGAFNLILAEKGGKNFNVKVPASFIK